MSVLVPEEVFRAYDVRGVVGTHLTEPFARELGKAVGTMIVRQGGRTITVGRDCRTHGPLLRKGFVEGLLSTGINVFDLGTVPSPLVYFSLFHWDTEIDGGVVITGSHNPKEFNGFKICIGKRSIHGAAIQTLRTMMLEHDYVEGIGVLKERPILREYIDHLKENLNPQRTDLKVVIDPGNGTAGPVIEPLLREMGFDVVALNCEMDGEFPNHHPDPTDPTNLEELVATVLETKADVGVAYDGDTDRIGVVDDQGDILWGDRLMILLSRRLLIEEPGAAIVGEVKCSQTLFDDIAANGGRPILSAVGHSLIKERMQKEEALLAGEMSGHIFYAHRYFGYDDAVYTTGRLLEVLAGTQKSLSQLMSDVPKTYVTPEIRIDCPDHQKFELVRRCISTFKSQYEVIDIDGARVLFTDGWGLVRASNTQPALVMRCESQSEPGLDRIKRIIEMTIERERVHVAGT